MRSVRFGSVVLILLAVLAQPGSAEIIVITADGIEGEFMGEMHRGASEVQSFASGIDHPVGVAQGAFVPGPLDISNIGIVKRVDKASPRYALKALNGEPIANVRIEFLREADSRTFLRYDLKDVRVTTYRPGASTGGNDVPLEEIAFSFAEVVIRYTPFGPDGQPTNPVVVGWNVLAGEPAKAAEETAESEESKERE